MVGELGEVGEFFVEDVVDEAEIDVGVAVDEDVAETGHASNFFCEGTR